MEEIPGEGLLPDETGAGVGKEMVRAGSDTTDVWVGSAGVRRVADGDTTLGLRLGGVSLQPLRTPIMLKPNNKIRKGLTLNI